MGLFLRLINSVFYLTWNNAIKKKKYCITEQNYLEFKIFFLKIKMHIDFSKILARRKKNLTSCSLGCNDNFLLERKDCKKLSKKLRRQNKVEMC